MLFQSGFAVLGGFSDVSNIPAEVLNVLVRPESVSMEPFQTTFDLLMFVNVGKSY